MFFFAEKHEGLFAGILPLLHSQWPRGVTISTLDSESSDRGSNPREAFPWLSDFGPPVIRFAF